VDYLVNCQIWATPEEMTLQQCYPPKELKIKARFKPPFLPPTPPLGKGNPALDLNIIG
jgi:hypothetical protein